MNQANQSQPLPTPPSDDRLIDYLLGESSEHDEAVGAVSDAMIEQWLACDPANAERLESLATSVLALSLSREQDLVAAAIRAADDAASNAGDPACSAANSSAAVSPATPSSSATSRRLVIGGLFATAAAITLAVFWSRGPGHSDELSTRRLAMAWMETADATVPAVELETEWAGEWESNESDEWLGSDGGEAFAVDQDSPPQWLLTAVDQMSLSGELHVADPEGLQ